MTGGLGAMTGAIPVVFVAGAATMMTKSMFGQAPQPARRKKKKSKKPSGWGHGNFSNIGL